MRALAALAGERLVHKTGEGDGVTVIYKRPQMVEGLGDLPWHRDCGMGGHAVLCPTLVLSLYLVEATPETGELVDAAGLAPRVVQHACTRASASAPRGAHFARARGRRVAALRRHHARRAAAAGKGPRGATAPARSSASRVPTRAHHRGEKSYNDVLHAREDGQIEHLEKVASRA